MRPLLLLCVAVLPVRGAALAGHRLLRAHGAGAGAGSGAGAGAGAGAAKGPLGDAIGAILGGGTADTPEEAARRGDSVWGQEGTTLPGTNVPGKVIGDLNVSMTVHGPAEHVVVPVKHTFYVNQTGNFTVAFNVSANMTVKPEIQHWTPGVVIVDSAAFRPPVPPQMMAAPLVGAPCAAPAAAPMAWPPPPCWLPVPTAPPPPALDATAIANKALQEIAATHVDAMKNIYLSNRAIEAAKGLRADLIRAAQARAAALSKIRVAAPSFR